MRTFQRRAPVAFLNGNVLGKRREKKKRAASHPSRAWTRAKSPRPHSYDTRAVSDVSLAIPCRHAAVEPRHLLDALPRIRMPKRSDVS